ncbi:hypothetical protein DE146DRAFT_602792 [Phaeosphaeria sp. MPI-PUGE-AT-0046c]|nr:hypothetical protein DE146DRAFT_602792 [Phaeosphaeria sp. MPI-PUGE-AT-0046c]
MPALWKAIWSRPSSSTSGTKWAGTFLLPAACLILIGAIQQPLYQILVSIEATPVATCSDTKYQFLSRNSSHCTERTSTAYKPLGMDIEPSQMDHVYHNTFLRRLTSDLESVSVDSKQPHLWSDYMPAEAWVESRSLWSGTLDERFQSLRPWLTGFTREDYKLPQFFVAGLPSNLTTGVLREHLMRFNSSISCELIDRASFPSSCPGKSPFIATLKKYKDTEIRVCVPGEIGAIPWTRSRNRQDITEQLYLDIQDGDTSGEHLHDQYRNLNATLRCEAKTTRGFFELGNTWNNDTYTNLLSEWPSHEQMLDNYNDWVATSVGGAGFVPSESDDYESGIAEKPSISGTPSESWRVSGPLTMSAIALFGNTSWLHSAITYTANMTYADAAENKNDLSWQRICAGMPFAGLVTNDATSYSTGEHCRWADEAIADGRNPRPIQLLRLIHSWIESFVPDMGLTELDLTESLFQVSMFIANRALLTFYSPETDIYNDRAGYAKGRSIYYAPGQLVQKPVVSTPTLIALTILLAMQLVGLAYLAYYIYHIPTWSSALDAMAIARIGATLGQQDVLPPIGAVSKKDYEALKDVDGLIGIVGSKEEDRKSQRRLSPGEIEAGDLSDVELQQVERKGPYVSVGQHSPGMDMQLGLGASRVIRSDSGNIGSVRRPHQNTED